MEKITWEELTKLIQSNTYLEGKSFEMVLSYRFKRICELHQMLENHHILSYQTSYQRERDVFQIHFLNPIDTRVKETTPAYYSNRKYLPIGIDDYATIRKGNYYYVDKTKMIEEFLLSDAMVTLITRPRRFGKTINMSMLAEFFDITKHSEQLFQDTYISRTSCMEHMNRYPVIFLSFRRAHDQKENIIKQIITELREEYERYADIIIDLKGMDQRIAQNYLSCFCNTDYTSLLLVNDAIWFLSKVLYKHYGKQVILLIDEHDTPFLESYTQGCYEELQGDLSELLGSALKGNPYLYRAVLTGIQRIAKQNIFSKLNNLVVCGMNQKQYRDMFGFTTEETKKLLDTYDVPFNQKVKDRYDGYRIYGCELYNPWSILNYASTKQLSDYWVNTAGNQLIKQTLKWVDASFYNTYQDLLVKGTAVIETDLSESYEYEEPSGIWSLLINAGYLNIMQEINDETYVVTIVNKEMRKAFKAITATVYHVSHSLIIKLLNTIVSQDMDAFKQHLEALLLGITSYHDLINENSYHMILLTLCMFVDDDYEVHSNMEQGKGRYDIYLKSKKGNQDILMELKYTKDETMDLKTLADKGLQQIKDRQYVVSSHTLMAGLAFRGKHVEMSYETFVIPQE